MPDSDFVTRRWRARLGLPEALKSRLSEPGEARQHLRIHGVQVFVRDQDRSVEFYVDRLGFDLLWDSKLSSDLCWTAVAPPDGSALLVLLRPSAGPEEHRGIGGPTGVFLVTDDINAKYREWSNRGVRFHHPPLTSSWGGSHTVFEDLDGNSFHLVQSDRMTEILEAERRAAEERLQAERSAAREMEIATEVQARLFPQRFPPLDTLDYAGFCVQARQVGGDYYDFLDFGRGRLGIVIGDVAGKGMAAALLMANLQASLRSHYVMALDDLPRLLTSVNRLFYENTPDSAYATLFFGAYDDATQRLRYVNCGHLAPFLLRSSKTIERLDPTCSVLGMFGNLQCEAAEVRLSPGDVLVLYTDGVTEALDEEGQEFGEERLVAVLRASAHLTAQELLQVIVEAVKRFSGVRHHDDVTLLTARCRGRDN